MNEPLPDRRSWRIEITYVSGDGEVSSFITVTDQNDDLSWTKAIEVATLRAAVYNGPRKPGTIVTNVNIRRVTGF